MIDFMTSDNQDEVLKKCDKIFKIIANNMSDEVFTQFYMYIFFVNFCVKSFVILPKRQSIPDYNYFLERHWRRKIWKVGFKMTLSYPLCSKIINIINDVADQRNGLYLFYSYSKHNDNVNFKNFNKNELVQHFHFLVENGFIDGDIRPYGVFIFGNVTDEGHRLLKKIKNR